MWENRYLSLGKEIDKLKKNCCIFAKNDILPKTFTFLAKMILLDFWSLNWKTKLSSEAPEKVMYFFKQP